MGGNEGEVAGQSSRNCAKNDNSNFSHNNQMAHIHPFFTHHLPLYYTQITEPQLKYPDFLLPTTSNNIHSLTLDLLLSSQDCLPCSAQSLTWLMPYSILQDATLPPQSQDSMMVCWLKSKLCYIQVQMLQIMVRLVLCYQEGKRTTCLNNTIQGYIEEICYIYPALKIEVSFGFQWWENMLVRVQRDGHIGGVFRRVLQKISKICNLIGPVERLLMKYSEQPRVESQSKQTPRKEEPIQTKLGSIVNLQRNPSDSKDMASQRASSVSNEKRSNFDEFDTFRRKKKMIAKDRLKTSTEGICRTPNREQQYSSLNSPTTDKTTSLAVCSDTTEHNASSILYRKLRNNNNKPVKRTIYFNQTNKFMPKRIVNTSSEGLVQPMNNFLHSNSVNFEQVVRMSSRKPSRLTADRQQCQDSNMFCVPATPKREQLNKLHKTHSTDIPHFLL